ncbi:hypothetical protein Q667_16140 [Marinobacter sp. C1S70]|nr:hypothetical protein Q667_16140 [Marinobacter sp. C1S70]
MRYQNMKTLTLIVATIALSLSATSALAMNGQANRFNEARSFPDKTIEHPADVKVSGR